MIFLAVTMLAASLIALPLNGQATAATRSVGILDDASTPTTSAVSSTSSVNIGVRFTSERPGKVTALQFYRSPAQTQSYTASLWDLNGTLLGQTTFPASSTPGWQTASLPTPVSLNKGRRYVASYLASGGRHVVTPDGFADSWEANGFIVPAGGGVAAAGTKSVRPRSSADGANFLVDVVFEPHPRYADPEPTPETGDWPAAHNTGVPDGTTLTTYTGPLTITTPNTVIRNAVVDGTLRIQAPDVEIINSRINGTVDLRYPRTNDYSFSITDSEVHIGDNLNTGLMRGNFTATRVEITGGRRSVYCEINCVVEDSWVHAQGGDEGGDAHFSGIRMGESTTLRHNTITCEALRGPGTGCSAGLTGYGDFGPVQNNLIENNIFLGGGGGGSTVCAYGGSSGDNGSKPYGHLANNIRFVDNVFVRGETGQCGNLRAVLSFDPTRPGNVWSGNTWDDGSAISYND
ncbi:hypothetical protein BJF81_14095 [Ornithinimicrobium sp. CNJ-824]|uniref:DUF4082 domain-containing protein n=1 Tax=Ornithinimicrobium sp. CNJ-824 TaxID=1904966 RepID=UPI0009637E18|nr:DUF4082 domain-containing protein [Ornithinimicrobium sp. CNJ-824]OLT21972.1 hypothetical protein BJF81_14095 [Ornithinimicrobium sp. CNJ-824]